MLLCVYGLFLWQCCSPNAGSLPGQDDNQTLKYYFGLIDLKSNHGFLEIYQGSLICCTTNLGHHLLCPCLLWCMAFHFLVGGWDGFWKRGGQGSGVRNDFRSGWRPSQTFQEVQIERGMEKEEMEGRGSREGWSKRPAVYRREGLSKGWL